jgi:hypothetical protein
MKHKSEKGDSFLYLFIEKEPFEQEMLNVDQKLFFKIGIVSHNTTDEGISDWPKYVQHEHPVSIARRLFKLMNGNPRIITPLMWLKFESNDAITASKLSKSIETKWLREFRSMSSAKEGNIIQSPTSSEWFQTSKINLEKIVRSIIEKETGKYSQYYVLHPFSQS